MFSHCFIFHSRYVSHNRGIGTAQEALLPFLQDDTLGLEDEGRRETSGAMAAVSYSFIFLAFIVIQDIKGQFTKKKND